MNIDNLEFSTHFNGLMDVHKECGGTFLDLHVNGNLLCYQSWSQAASPLNSKKRKVFGLPPSMFVKAIHNFHNTNRYGTLYTPTVSLKIGEEEDLTLVTCGSIDLVIDDLKNQILRLQILTNFEDLNLQKNINLDSIIAIHGNKNLKVKGLFSEFRFYHLNHDLYLTDNNIVFKPEEQVRDKGHIKNSLGNRELKVIKNKFLFNDICHVSYDDEGHLVLMVDNEEGIRNLVMHQCWNEHDLLDSNFSLNRYLTCAHPSELERLMTVFENYIQSEGLETGLPIDEIGYRPTCLIDIKNENQSYIGVLKSFKLINELDDNILNSRSKLQIVLSLEQIEGLKNNKPPTGNNMEVFIHMDAVGLMMTRDIVHPDGREIVEDVFGNSHTINESFYYFEGKEYSTATNRPVSEQFWNTVPAKDRPANYPTPDWLKTNSKSADDKNNAAKEPNNKVTDSKYRNQVKGELKTCDDKDKPTSCFTANDYLMQAYFIQAGKLSLQSSVLNAIFTDPNINIETNGNDILNILLGNTDDDDDEDEDPPVNTVDKGGDVMSTFIKQLQELINGKKVDPTLKWFQTFGEGLGNFILMMGAFEGIRHFGSGFLKNTYVGKESLYEKLGNGIGKITKPMKTWWTKRFGNPAQRAKTNSMLEQSGAEAKAVQIAEAEEALQAQAQTLETANGLLNSAPTAEGTTAGDVIDFFNSIRADKVADMLEGEGSTAIDALFSGEEVGATEVLNAANELRNMATLLKSPAGQARLKEISNNAAKVTNTEISPTQSSQAFNNTQQLASDAAEDAATAAAQAKQAAKLASETERAAAESAVEASDAAMKASEFSEDVVKAFEDSSEEFTEALESGDAELLAGTFENIAGALENAVASTLDTVEALADTFGTLFKI